MFVSGEDPWPRYELGRGDSLAMCYGPVEVSLVSKEDDQFCWYGMWEMLGKTQDRVSKASMAIRGEIVYG